jgi:hypothetical protein
VGATLYRGRDTKRIVATTNHWPAVSKGEAATVFAKNTPRRFQPKVRLAQLSHADHHLSISERFAVPLGFPAHAGVEESPATIPSTCP